MIKIFFEKYINPILDNPTLFNSIRYLLAGDQHETKNFVRDNLFKYKCKSVLDVGCGTGDFAAACPSNTDYLGTDINPKFIKFAKNNIKSKNIAFAAEDVLLSKYTKKYDAVMLISLMHHFSDDDFNEILKKVKKITKKIIIIADIIPNPPGFLQKIAVKYDRGKYIRAKAEKIKLLKKHFKIKETAILKSRLAVQFGIICEP